MRVQWNSVELVPLDIGDDPNDYNVECSRPDGSQATVKRTQINGAGEVWITLNGYLGSSGVKPQNVIVDRYSIRCFTYENDSKPSYEAPILKSEVKGKSVRLQVDVCL